MTKKINLEEVVIPETLCDKICKAVEYGILPGAILLMLVSVNMAFIAAGIAGMLVSAWKLVKSFLKHNKDIKTK